MHDEVATDDYPTTVVTVEPERVAASLTDGRVCTRIATDDVRIHLEQPVQPPAAANDLATTLLVCEDDDDFTATIDLTCADVTALVAGVTNTKAGIDILIVRESLSRILRHHASVRNL